MRPNIFGAYAAPAMGQAEAIDSEANRLAASRTPRREHLTLWLAIALVIAASSIIRLRLLDVPLERDEGEYAYMAQRLLHGVPPYVSAYSMKLPGIYAAYALSMLVLGQSIQGVHLGLVLANAITTLLMLILGRRLLGAYGGIVAGAAFAFLSLGKPVLGLTANAEHFVLLPLVAGLIQVLRGLEARSNRLLFSSGLLFGCALLIKQHGGFFIPFGALAIVLHSICAQRIPTTTLIKRVLVFIGASAIPLLLTGAVYLGLGGFQKLWFWTVVFPRSYVTTATLASGLQHFITAFETLITWGPLLWLFAGFGVAVLFLERRMYLRMFVLALLVFSFASVTPGLFFRGHYFLLCLPAISLLAGCGMDCCRRALMRLSLVRGQGSAVSAAIAVVVFSHSIIPERGLLFQMSPNAVGTALYFPDPFSFAACISVADYIKQHSGKAAKVAVIGSEPQIYFYLNRPAPTEFIYLYYLTERHRFTEQLRNEFTGELEAAAPQYLVYSPSWTSELVSEEARVKLVEWYQHFVHSQYRIIGVVEMGSADRTEYVWGKDAENHKPWARLRMLIYEKKSAQQLALGTSGS